MKNLSIQAKAYILAIVALGAVLFIRDLPRLRADTAGILLAACALAAVTQVLKVEGSTNRSSYNIAWMVFGFTFLLLGDSATLFVILVAHLAEWVWHKYPWYIQLFNIASYALAIEAAAIVYAAISLSALPLQLSLITAAVAGIAAFTLVNHLLVGIVIWLARGQNFAKSGVFGPLTLMIDFSLLCLGAAAAFIWPLNPYAVVMTIAPLYLIYSTLRVPALERQTDIDSKTGLYNAGYFNRALQKELVHANRTGQPLTVAVADLDLLRNINNTYGHLAGDVVLIGVAQLLQKSVRPYDVVARFGGEEFAILMPEVVAEQALTRLEAMRAVIERNTFEVTTSVTPIQVTMSFGIAAQEGPNQTASEVLHNADLALYHSKLTGRNRVSLYSFSGVHDLSSVAPRPGPDSPAPTEDARIPLPPPRLDQEPRVSEYIHRPEPAIKTQPAWRIKAYIGGVALAALALLAFELPWNAPINWFGLGFMGLIMVLAEGLAIDIYVNEASVSTAVIPFVAGVLLYGPAGALILSLVLAATALIKNKSPISRFVFNAGNHLISGLLCIILVRLAGVTAGSGAVMTAGQWFEWFLVATAAAGVAYISSTSLIALAIHFDSGQSTGHVWSERFRWLAPSYLVMGVVSFILIFSYLELGLLGGLAIILPLAILRFSQKQYIDRTKAMVNQLRTINAARIKQTEEVSALNEELLMTLAHVIDLRDPYVSGHSQHVARYAVLVASELGLPAERIELVRKAALLHDIGKLGISEAILFKPGPLSPMEYEAVKLHSALGAEIIAECHLLRQLVPIVRHHHERYDGRGYPDRLGGEDTPLEARILGLADAIEAMASDRPYRRGAGSQLILRELQDHLGTQFDPLLVQAFGQVLSREGQATIVNSAKEVRPRPALAEEGVELGASVMAGGG